MPPKKRRPAQSKTQRRRRASAPGGPHDLDAQHIATAMSRIRDSATRYLLAMLIDLATERIEQLEAETARRKRRRPRKKSR